MALPLRTRTLCLQKCTADVLSTSRPQSRGAKKMAKPSGMSIAKLRKDVPTFGPRGAMVPVPKGLMRNRWFPHRIADYVTYAEQRTLKRNNITFERDYNFGKEETPAPAVEAPTTPFGGINAYNVEQAAPLPTRRKVQEIEKLTPERSLELLDIFVHPRLDFYRQPLPPVVEEVVKEEAPKKEERLRTASSAAADLLAVRTSAAPKPKADQGPQGIYGSVSAQDVLVAVRAATATNDEAAKITLKEEDITFMDESVGRAVKFVGDFTIEIAVKGAERGLRRTVRVIPQDAA